MILSKLDITSFRVIEQLTLVPHPSLNLITGNNGSGKSSLLEAIQCLATGHSFRTRKSREHIRHSANSYMLTSVFTDVINQQEHRAGLERNRDGSVNLRLDFEVIKSQSTIARLLPVKALTPDSHRLIQEGPDERRQFLDWGLFHVEPLFHGHWQNYRRALSQRNQLLREHANQSDIASWDEPLVLAANAIDAARARYHEQLQRLLQLRLERMNATFHVKLRYRPGWDKESDLHQVLVKHLPTHRKMKTTTDGPHRADLVVYSGDTHAKHVLSRGQQKVLVYLLHLCQLDILAAISNRKAIVLCDDLTSELDTFHSQALVTQLVELQSQIFVSGVDVEALSNHPSERFQMNHGSVEKGL